jgi:GrpB-like predicted nucleotidyltransferase (UPF0157 family)
MSLNRPRVVLPGGAESYARTKRELANREWPSMQHYTEAKTEVIEGIIARAAARRTSQEA